MILTNERQWRNCTWRMHHVVCHSPRVINRSASSEVHSAMHCPNTTYTYSFCVLGFETFHYEFLSDTFWYNSWYIYSKLFILNVMHAEFLTHILSGHSVQFIVIFIIKTSVLLSRVLGKKWHFCAMGLPGAPLIVCTCALFVPVFQCHALKRHRPIDKKCNFFFWHPSS